MKVTVNPQAPAAPTAAPTQFELSDATGRTIVVKKPGVLSQYRLVEALGHAAANQVYMAMTMPLLFVSSIDGDPITQPRTKAEVEALIQRLGDEGVTTLMTEIPKLFTSETQEETVKKSAE